MMSQLSVEDKLREIYAELGRALTNIVRLYISEDCFLSSVVTVKKDGDLLLKAYAVCYPCTYELETSLRTLPKINTKIVRCEDLYDW
jgi:hypothetical protein